MNFFSLPDPVYDFLAKKVRENLSNTAHWKSPDFEVQQTNLLYKVTELDEELQELMKENI